MMPLKHRWLKQAAVALVVVLAVGGVSVYAKPWLFIIGEDLGVVMSVEEAHLRATAGEIVLVDVRKPSEWRKTGVPQSARLITMHQDNNKFLAGLEKATGGDKTKALALICARGGRSTHLLKPLEAAGYTNLINVAAGMKGGPHGKGWLKTGLPTRQWTPETSKE